MSNLVMEHLRFKQAILVAILFACNCFADDKPSPPKTITNSIGMELVLIPAGEFVMGIPEQYRDAYPPHRVKISKSFYLAKTELTQGEWVKVIGSKPWKDNIFVKEGANYPATYMNWNDAVFYCRLLSEKEGKRYRLPTEAEWEYACRAGTTTAFNFGDDEHLLSDYGWWKGNKSNDVRELFAHEVSQLRPNAWGLYDMHGNVSEWCDDWYAGDYYKRSPLIDPRGFKRGTLHVHRGGGWSSEAALCKSSARDAYKKMGDTGRYDIGFRIALETDDSTPITKDTPPTPPTFNNSLGMTLVKIPTGEFTMGSSDPFDKANPPHSVQISKPFFISATEVSQDQWKRLMPKLPWKQRKNVEEGPNYAASYVNWEDAEEYCHRLSEKEGMEYRLPTEAEWEYACRAGTKTNYSFGDAKDDLSDFAWWGGLSGGGNALKEQYPHEVAKKKPNPWGLFDMHGNVYEWCSDWYGENYYAMSPSIDPKGPDSGQYHVYRGGSALSHPMFCRSAVRFWANPTEEMNDVGFRVVMEVDTEKQE